MRDKFDSQLLHLESQLTQMGELCETAIEKATQALREGDADLAKTVIREDENIDQLEKDIERLCLKLLLKQQPVARDLRRISAALKMITDLERIGDQTADIADIIIAEKPESLTDDIELIGKMADEVCDMVRSSISAYVKNDLDLAQKVIAQDDAVDEYFDRIRDKMVEYIRTEHGLNGAKTFDLIMITKYLERIGDHAQNVAEWVEYSITGVHKDYAGKQS